MPNTETVTLDTPITRGETTIETITLREPTAGEMRGMDNFDVLRMNVDAHRKLIPRISGMTANEYDALNPKDLMALQTAVVNFFVE